MGAATTEAFELFDANGDGRLSKDELAKCPSVLNALSAYDKDNDQQVSKEEMEARMALWKSGGAMLTVDCLVTMDGRPLGGAEVKFVPEKYLAETLKPASGTTGTDGRTTLGVDPELLPAEHRRIRAVYAGDYRIEVTHPSITVPSKYNAETTLGREVFRDTIGVPIEKIELKSK